MAVHIFNVEWIYFSLFLQWYFICIHLCVLLNEFKIKQLLSVSSVMYLEITLGKKMQDKGINHCLSIKNNKNNPMSFPAASS